jgi:S-adenosylmethionine hydrolase
LLVPDNGCWTLLPGGGAPPTVIRLTEARFWRQPVSATFHGRDILAPVAGHLSLGLDPLELGPVMTEWVKLDQRPATATPERLSGEVIFVDHFGNLITNIPGEALAALRQRPVRIVIQDREVPRRVRTYGEAPPGELVALVSSAGLLEIAVVQGSAAERLRVGVGAAVTVSAPAPPA